MILHGMTVFNPRLQYFRGLKLLLIFIARINKRVTGRSLINTKVVPYLMLEVMKRDKYFF